MTWDIRGGMYKPKQDPLQKQAESLVFAAQINATSMFVPLLERFPFLREADIQYWDFIVTVAGIFMGSSCLNNLRVGDAREEKLMEIVAEFPAWGCGRRKRSWPILTIRAYFERILRGKKERRKIALVATAHYLLRCMHALLVNGAFWHEAA